MGLRLTAAGVPREGFEVVTGGDEVLGRMTSGGFSPALRAGIGMAYLPASRVAREGAEVFVVVRGKKVPAVTTKMPFLEPKYYRTK